MNDFILKIDGITKSYVRNIIDIRGEETYKRFFIIDDLDLMIPRGKITALIGDNGAGKTTLFNIISRFSAADSGTMIYQKNGEISISLESLLPYQVTREGIGRLFQDSHIFPDMTVLDNMLLADGDDFGEQPFLSLLKPKRHNKVEQKRVEKASQIFIDLFGESNPFWEKRSQPAGALSYGQQRLLGLARLFMREYDLVLLDEPTAGVNPQIIQQLLEIISRMVVEKGMTVFLIEHNMKVVLEVADCCSFMSHGRITALGTPEEVAGNDDVRSTYWGA